MIARLVERAGFSAVYMTGSGTALMRNGLPDVGLLTMTEMVANAKLIADAVNIPVIADADTGFGNPINVQRTVYEYEVAGVAAIHIEDQALPKKCGHLTGKSLVTMSEMVNKIHAATDARRNADFVIIARTDAIAVSGLNDALERGEAYAEAGADVVFVEAPTTMQEIETIGRHPFGVPLLFNMSTSGKTPTLSSEELARLGYRLMILPNFTTLAAIKAVQNVLAVIRATGSTANLTEECADFAEFMDLAGLRQVQVSERKYDIAEQQRTSI
jgi:2-methylisocitrate lyase-like PEP mutase family enzyme